MHRAHIFHSFDALKGFREMIDQQNQVIVEKRKLSEDELQELDYTIQEVKVGMIIRLVYFNQRNYIEVEGIVAKLNLDTKIIQVVKEKISILNIVELEILQYHI